MRVPFSRQVEVKFIEATIESFNSASREVLDAATKNLLRRVNAKTDSGVYITQALKKELKSIKQKKEEKKNLIQQIISTFTTTIAKKVATALSILVAIIFLYFASSLADNTKTFKDEAEQPVQQFAPHLIMATLAKRERDLQIWFDREYLAIETSNISRQERVDRISDISRKYVETKIAIQKRFGEAVLIEADTGITFNERIQLKEFLEVRLTDTEEMLIIFNAIQFINNRLSTHVAGNSETNVPPEFRRVLEIELSKVFQPRFPVLGEISNSPTDYLSARDLQNEPKHYADKYIADTDSTYVLTTLFLITFGLLVILTSKYPTHLRKQFGYQLIA